MIRQPAVANRFYPGDPDELEQTVHDLLPTAEGAARKAITIVSPHAGYVYSGAMAGKTIGSAAIPGTVVILGPNHHGRGARAAVSTATWQLPGGPVSCDLEIANDLIAATPLLSQDEQAHLLEHSLEVQVPFLQALQPDLKIVAIALSNLSYQECTAIAGALSAVVEQADKEVLLLASTDMSHYESRSSASAKDQRALDHVLKLDPEGLYRTVRQERISMCGFIPVTIALQAAINLGAKEAELIGYTDSGAVSGDTEQVVGYAGVIIG